MVDMDKLNEGLSKLRGLDFEQAEARARVKNSTAFDISVSKEFQARLAAMALQVPYEDIVELPLKDYARVCLAVVNFLYAPSEDETPSASSEV